MLDPWIIEQIRRREEERRRNEQPVLELPLPDMTPWPSRNESGHENDDDESQSDRGRGREKAPERGVVIIGL